jgi:hypothetical protein
MWFDLASCLINISWSLKNAAERSPVTFVTFNRTISIAYKQIELLVVTATRTIKYMLYVGAHIYAVGWRQCAICTVLPPLSMCTEFSGSYSPVGKKASSELRALTAENAFHLDS